jgi:hypothetical protein
MRFDGTQLITGMTIGAALLGAGMLLGGFSRSPVLPQAAADIVRARQVDIVDELGTVVLSIGSDERGGTIQVRDRFGKTLVQAGAGARGGEFTLSTTEGRAAASMAAGNAGGGATFFGENGAAEIELGVIPAGPRLALSDGGGHPVAEIRARTETGGVISAFNAKGEVASRLFTDAAGCGVVETYRPRATPLVSIGSTVGGHGQITTYAGNDKPLVSISASAENQGQVFTYSDAGIPLIALAGRPAPDNCASLRIFNRHGEAVITVEPDEDDLGEIGVWRRDGTGRVISP